MIISNLVKKEKLREVQSETLEVLAEALTNSFGPFGSNTTICEKMNETVNNIKYSKDGHTILKSILFQNEIENSVKTDLENITRHIVKTVGDGTTSAIILANEIFKTLNELETNRTPYQIIQDLKTIVPKMKEEILSNKVEFSAEMAYDISMISTNGNVDVASNVKNIYEKFGSDVFVDVSISNTTESYLKTYDGMTLETGYSDTAYVNDVKKAVCSIRNPRIYMFEDPVDTREMFALFDTIIDNNIMKPYMEQRPDTVVPTVILAPTVSRDMSAYMERLIEFMYKFDAENASSKPPFLLITNMHQQEELLDIARMCGCKALKKYINPDQQKIDIENGLAATPDTVCDFYGTADIVEADMTKTKFVNPKEMYDSEGNQSIVFKTLVKFLETELGKAIASGENASVTGKIKRRINSLKSNMVEYLVGGISMGDRDSVRDLVEDSILNCRSAAVNGVGYGANYEALRASFNLLLNDKENSLLKIIYQAYFNLNSKLYSTGMTQDKVSDMVELSLEKGMPFNLKNNSFDGKVLCSIDSDIVIFEAVIQIISLMFTSNQFICPSVHHNKYIFNN